MTAISELLEEAPPAVAPSVPMESPETLERYRKAYEYKVKGVPVESIANAYKVAPSTIYRWIKIYEEQFALSMSQTRRANLLFDRMIFAELVRDLAMAEAHQITLDATYSDPTTGKIVAGKLDANSRKVKAACMKLALEADQSVFRMLHQTGVLPSAAKEIHCTVQDTDPGSRIVKSSETRTAAEIAVSISQLLQNSRVVQMELPPDVIEIATEAVDGGS